MTTALSSPPSSAIVTTMLLHVGKQDNADDHDVEEHGGHDYVRTVRMLESVMMLLMMMNDDKRMVRKN